MLKEPPTPTLPPAAEASLAMVRTTAFWASIFTSPLTVSFSPAPSFALVYAPLTSNAATGVTDTPPWLPALACMLSFALWAAVTSIEVRGAATVRFSLSSTSATTSTLLTPMAMPAPTPTLPDAALLEVGLLASALTVISSTEDAFTVSSPPLRVTFAAPSTTA